MRRRDFIKFLPSAALSPWPGKFARAAENKASSETGLPQVDVRRDFGARGDGVADDWQAIERAGIFLEAQGGGRMYFPTGRYRLPSLGKNLTVRNNIEYFGDGVSSVIVGSNAGFVSPNGAIFGRNGYRNYAYFQAHDIRAGDQSITTNVAADADRFKAGDIIIARSATAIESPDDSLPHYVEMNRVLSASSGVVYLEDPIDDGWKGVMVANVTGDVSQGYSIHDLRIETEHGFPFFVQASYKAEFRNCSTRGLSAMTVNGFTRSVAHHITAAVLWSAERSESVLEIETGSVRAAVHDIEVQLIGHATPGQRYPLLYCQEFSRRTNIWNIRIDASQIAVAAVIQTLAGGHSFENIRVIAQSVDKVLDYFCGDPGVFSLNHLPLTLKSITVDTLDRSNGFGHGFILYNKYPNGTVENVTIQDCVINGVTDHADHNLIWFLRGDQRNILFEDVRGSGDIKLGQDNSQPTVKLTNVQIRDCQYRKIVSEGVPKQTLFANNRSYRP
jgi:Pectate lyase superfamily protein